MDPNPNLSFKKENGWRPRNEQVDRISLLCSKVSAISSNFFVRLYNTFYISNKKETTDWFAPKTELAEFLKDLFVEINLCSLPPIPLFKIWYCSMLLCSFWKKENPIETFVTNATWIYLCVTLFTLLLSLLNVYHQSHFCWSVPSLVSVILLYLDFPTLGALSICCSEIEGQELNILK